MNLSHPRHLRPKHQLALYVIKPTKVGDSTRAIRTMEATGHAPGLSLEVRYTRDEIDELVKAILKAKPSSSAGSTR